MNIQTKINIGDTVYFLNRVRRETCPVCGGSGKICLGTAIKPNFDTIETLAESVGEQFVENLTKIATGNVKEYTCPECNGKGTVAIKGQARYEVGSGTVSSIEAIVNRDKTTMVYHVCYSGSNHTLTENSLFTDLESANNQCTFMNLERKEVSIGLVKVPKSFASTIPCNEKLTKRIDEWRYSGKFNTEIYVDENMNLFDGYTAYLTYRMFGVSDIPVVIWPNSLRRSVK